MIIVDICLLGFEFLVERHAVSGKHLISWEKSGDGEFILDTGRFSWTFYRRNKRTCGSMSLRGSIAALVLCFAAGVGTVVVAKEARDSIASMYRMFCTTEGCLAP